jgi:Siphovirus Gp157.
MTWLHVDIADFKAHVAELLAAYPELTEDEQLREDMIVGETEIESIVKRLVKIRTEASAMAAAVKQIKQDNAERQARFERKADGASALLKSLLLAADLDKVTLPEATVSVTKPRTKCVIDDVNKLPQGFYVTERKPKTAEIKAALEAGEQIPGARLELVEEGLMVRTR